MQFFFKVVLKVLVVAITEVVVLFAILYMILVIGLQSVAQFVQSRIEHRKGVVSTEFSVFQTEGQLGTVEQFSDFPMAIVENGYANYYDFYGTVNSFEYFTQYVNEVNDYLWDKEFAYIGQIGKLLNKIVMFSTYEFAQDHTPRVIDSRKLHQFIVSTHPQLSYSTKLDENGKRVNCGNGNLKSPCCFELYYYDQAQEYYNEKSGVRFTYNFTLCLKSTSGVTLTVPDSTF